MAEYGDTPEITESRNKISQKMKSGNIICDWPNCGDLAQIFCNKTAYFFCKYHEGLCKGAREHIYYEPGSFRKSRKTKSKSRKSKSRKSKPKSRKLKK